VTLAASAPEIPPIAPDPGRDPAHLLDATLRTWHEARRRHGPGHDLWLFGYASLIWRPECQADEVRAAHVHGWHRALQMRSRVNRGTPQRPGLVFALLPGGSCQGVVYRIGQGRAESEIKRLWHREMPTGVYDPRWLEARTPQGKVSALAFTLSRRSPAWVGRMDDTALVQALGAVGRFGSTLDYLLETDRALRERGIRDREVDRHVRLARRAGLCSR
jgi:glutathione-specific gamma-glutamylcyclotransferase